MTVFIVHALTIWYPEIISNKELINLAHGAVVIFFSLSGFLIGYTTNINNKGLREYAIARLSRLYSIFIPSIIITVICSIIIFYFDPILFSYYDRGNNVFRYLVSLVFCNEIWFFSSAPLINGPIWSLSYEFWFYSIFGTVHFYNRNFKSAFIIVLICAIAGPKILLLMAIWAFGYLAFKYPSPSINTIISWLIVLSLFSIIVFLIIYLPDLPYEVPSYPLFWASKFFTDIFVGIFVGLAFWILPNTNFINNKYFVKYLRKISNLTFAIYAIHYPIQILTKLALSTFKLTYWNEFTFGLLLSLATCAIIGYIIDSYRLFWTVFFSRLINFSKIVNV